MTDTEENGGVAGPSGYEELRAEHIALRVQGLELQSKERDKAEHLKLVENMAGETGLSKDSVAKLDRKFLTDAFNKVAENRFIKKLYLGISTVLYSVAAVTSYTAASDPYEKVPMLVFAAVCLIAASVFGIKDNNDMERDTRKIFKKVVARAEAQAFSDEQTGDVVPPAAVPEPS